jgi:hypothetical protein
MFVYDDRWNFRACLVCLFDFKRKGNVSYPNSLEKCLSELFGCLKRGECGEIVQEPLRRMCYLDFDGSGGVKYMKAHPI